MDKDNVVELLRQAGISDPLTALLRKGARQLIEQAVEAEVQVLLGQYHNQRTKDGKVVVVRNGYPHTHQVAGKVLLCLKNF